MRYMIASDIHGSNYFCSKLIERFEKEKADKLVLLGDILYHGPRNALPELYDAPKTAELLNQYKDKIVCVRGNCDAEVDQMMLDFPVLSEFGVIDNGCKTAYLVHGHKLGMVPGLAFPEGSIVFSGHTHIPHDKTEAGVRYVNPGSVSIPKKNSWNGYIIMEDEDIIWKDLDGNVHSVDEIK